MPNKNFNELTVTTTIDGTELVPVVSGGVTKSVSVATINSGIAVDTVSDVYDARDIAQGQASIAAAAATVAGSIAQQDLSAVSAGLHRSPNAVSSMFIYDTSKDSDGGLWTDKCQHTSWYNEGLSGKWLGAWNSEALARTVGASTYGVELISNGGFNSDTNGWTVGGTAAGKVMSAINGVLLLERSGGNGTVYATQAITTQIGKLYRVSGSVINVNGPATSGFLAGTSAGGSNLGYDYTNSAARNYVFTFIATGTTTYTLIATKTSTGCTATDSVTATVNAVAVVE
jgi:hypothetical protein